ncbi:MAG TPA: hypothetical protein VGD78_07130 [Chthoniobacterales bacterium]
MTLAYAEPLVLTQQDIEPKPYSEIDLLDELTPGQAGKLLLFVPRTAFHLHIAFMDNTEFVVSFDGRIRTERDDLNTYAVPEAWNLHLDGIPVSEADLDFALETGTQVLENWLLEQGGLA